MIFITDQNAFYLRVTAQTKAGSQMADVDLSVIKWLVAQFVRRGRSLQSMEIDSQGRAVIFNSGDLAMGVYGVEFNGYYNGQPWRFFEKKVFAIVDQTVNAVEQSGEINGIPVFDVTLTITLGGEGVPESYVTNAINEHDNDMNAHPYLQELIENAGKVDDVKVNGLSVVDENKEANINITATIDGNVGEPEVDVEQEDGEIRFAFRNMKGEKGETGPEGKQGPQGDSFQPIGDVSGLVLAHTTGQDNTKAMSQKGVTDELEGIVANYETDVVLKYEGTEHGVLSAKTGWGYMTEFIPINNGDRIEWHPGASNNSNPIPALVIYNSNKEPIANWSANAADRNWNLSNTNAAFVRCSFLINVNGVKNTTPLKVAGMSYSLIEKVEGVKDKITDLQSRMNEVETAVVTIPELENGKGQSETNGMTQKAITNAIDGLESEILDGVDSNYEKGKYFKYVNSNPTGIPEDKAGCGVFKENIPITNEYAITWRFGTYNIGALVFYDSNGDAITNFGANETDGDRNIGTSSIPANAAYLNCSFDLSKVTIPITINGVDYPRVEPIPSLKSMADYSEVKDRVEDLEDIINQSDTEHGTIGQWYPEQVKEINNHLGASLGDRNNTYFKRLQFLHVSDNHGIADHMGYASQFLSFCPARFLVNTGDLVVDKYTDNHRTVDYAIAAAKPVYLVLGNHDYFKCPSHQEQYDTWYGDAETQGTLNHHNVELGGVSAEHSYYSVNYTSEKVKCIMLNMNDGWPDENLSSRALDDFSVGKMSQEQIEWFVTELQSAKVNDYHVCVFIHILPATIDRSKTVIPFSDFARPNTAIGLSFLHDLVDGFINGGTVSFTYDGNDYSATFTAGGVFVAWFSGHTHWDSVGWLSQYPKQFAVVITRPNARQMYYGGVGGSTRFNFVTIDTAQSSLAVYRVGEQSTVWGVDRKSFRIFYR